MLESADMTKNTTYSATITTLPQSKVEIKGEIIWDHVASFEEASFAKLAERLTLDGFRKGSIPTDIAKKHIPSELVLGEMAERAVQDIYPTIITDNALDMIGRPEVSITTLVDGQALGFTITGAVVPQITLPDHKKIALTIVPATPKEVSEADIDKVIEDLRQIRAYGHVHGEHDDHKHEEPLPEVNDEFAKSFGAFETVTDMRAKVKENLTNEAAQAARDKHRVAILEAVIAQTSFELPEVIIESESQKMLATIEADVARSGATIDEYFAHIQKTKEEVVAEFRPEAEKRARFQLVLNAIARKENLLPTEAEVEAEAQKLVAMYPGADLQRTKAYADMILTNEKVLQMLEK